MVQKTAALEAQGLRPVAVAEDFADAQALLVHWPVTVFSRWRLPNILDDFLKGANG